MAQKRHVPPFSFHEILLARRRDWCVVSSTRLVFFLRYLGALNHVFLSHLVLVKESQSASGYCSCFMF